MSNPKRIVYQEFGQVDNTAATERAVPDVPPQQQQLRVQVERKGRKGKTVTVVTGFQGKLETLNSLLKKLKTQCGTGGAVKDNTLELQGEHQQKLVQFLAELGYKVKASGS